MESGGLHETALFKQVYSPRTTTATLTDYNATTQAGATGIDTKGYDEAVCELSLGAIAAGTLTIDIMESATDDATAATVIAEAGGTEADFDAKGTAAQNGIHIIRVRTKDTKRYHFVRVVNSSGDSKAYAINYILSKAKVLPVTQDNTVDFTHSGA